MFNLPQEIIDLIYSFDCTKRENFDKVLKELSFLFSKLDDNWKCKNIWYYFRLPAEYFDGKVHKYKSTLFIKAYFKTLKYHKKSWFGKLKEWWQSKDPPSFYLLFDENNI